MANHVPFWQIVARSRHVLLRAQEILATEYDGDNVQVLFLADAIVQGLPVTAPMTSPNDSRKVGSVEYGMWVAAQQNRTNHIIAFTDADLPANYLVYTQRER